MSKSEERQKAIDDLFAIASRISVAYQVGLPEYGADDLADFLEEAEEVVRRYRETGPNM